MKKTLLFLSCISASLFINAQVCFSPATNFGVGTNPYSVTSADFNGDGIADLATANDQSSNVSIFLGTGNGSFGAAENFAVGTNPLSLISADFNGDGFKDLAIANYSSHDVSVLLGTGTGSFGAAVNFAVGAYPFSITSDDFNGDGIKDLAITNPYSSNVSVLMGMGTGSFGAAINFAVGDYPRSVIVADFNGDGNTDLAVANNFSDNVSVLLGTGAGGFGTATNFAVGSYPCSVISADFNGDTKADLAVANAGSNNVSVLLGSGTGSFGAAVNFAFGLSPVSVTSGDFNGDGKADLATANYNSSNVSVLLGIGMGSFAAPVNYAVGTTPYSVISVDFNGDAKPDLAVANYNSNNVSIIINNNSLVTTNISSQTNVLCNGASTGAVTINATGGTGFTYAWSPVGGTSATASGLTAGTYNCLVTNSCGNTSTIPVTITEPSAISVIAGIGSTICGGSAASLSAIASGGTGSFTYNWMPGSLVGASQTVSPSVSTTYIVTATDVNGCTSSTSQVVTVSGTCPISSVPCGLIVTNMTATANAVAVSGAISYKFKFYDNITNALVATKTQATRTCTFSTISNIFYGKTYNWTVSVDKGFGFGPESNNLCTVTFNAPKTTVPCGNSYTNLNTYTACQSIYGATNYRFSFYDDITNALVAVKVQPSNYIYFNTVAGLNYNKTYKWTVEAQYNDGGTGTLVYGPASSNSCLITFNAPKTNVPCGNSYTNLNTYTACQSVSGATNYRFSFYDDVTNALVAVKIQPSNYIYFNTVVGLNYNKTYKWTVEVQYNDGGTGTLVYGPASSNSCLITFNAPKTTVPCGNSYTNLNTYTACQTVSGATNYRFSFYDDVTNALVAVKVQPSSYIYFNTVVGLNYNKTYKWTVEVQYNDGGTGTLVYGPSSSNSCLITFNAPKTTVPCGNSYTNLNSYTTCQSVSGATNYRFSFYDDITNALVAVKVQPSNYIYFNTVAGLIFNKSYKWTVEVEYIDPNMGTPMFGPASSNVCTMIWGVPPAIMIDETNINDATTRLSTQSSGINDKQFLINLFPNPTKDKITVEASESINNIEVYSITGELILNEENSNSINLVDFANGFYIIHVKTVGGSKFFRVVKE